MNPLAKPKQIKSALYFNDPKQLMYLIAGNLIKKEIVIKTNVNIVHNSNLSFKYHIYIPSKNLYIRIYPEMYKFSIDNLNSIKNAALKIQPENANILHISIDTPIADLTELTKKLLYPELSDEYRRGLSCFAAKTVSYLVWNNNKLNIPIIYKSKEFNDDNLDLNEYSLNSNLFFNNIDRPKFQPKINIGNIQ